MLSFARDLGLRWIGWVTGLLISAVRTGPAAALARRLQLHLLRAPRRRPRTQPLRVRSFGAAAARRRREPGRRLPRRRLRLWAGVHARELSARPRLGARRPLVAEGGRRRSRSPPSSRSSRGPPRVRGVDPALARRVRRPQSARPRPSGRRRPQRRADGRDRDGRRRGRDLGPPGDRRRRFRRRGGGQGLRPSLRAVRAARLPRAGRPHPVPRGRGAALVADRRRSPCSSSARTSPRRSASRAATRTRSAAGACRRALSRASGIDVDFFRAILGALAIAGIVWLLVATARGFDWVRAAGWAALAVLVATAYMAPWYVIWLLPVAAISRDRALDRCDDPVHRVPGDQRHPDLAR